MSDDLKRATPSPGRTLVLGVGNPLIRDDGLGLVALDLLRSGWLIDPAVDFADGGTWGMNLLPMIEEAGRLLILDAIDLGLEPGTPVLLEREALPRYLGLKLSPHQIDLRDVLALADLRGALVADAVAVGLQPGRTDPEIGLSEPVLAALPDMIDAAIDRLLAWGHDVERAPVTSFGYARENQGSWAPPPISRAAPGTAPGSPPCS